MKKITIIVLLVAALVSLNSCGGSIATQTLRKDVTISTDRVVHLACDYPDRQDWSIHKAITKELEARGFKVVDRKAETFEKCDGIALRYKDQWMWDIAMYLRELRIRAFDGETGELLATALYSQRFFHSYPNPDNVVADLFVELDSKGVF